MSVKAISRTHEVRDVEGNRKIKVGIERVYTRCSIVAMVEVAKVKKKSTLMIAKC